MLEGASVIGYHLARPENAHDVAFYVVVLGVSVVGVVVGIGALIRPARALPPRWLPTFLVSVAMLAVGAIAVVMIPRRSVATSVSSRGMADLPALITRNFVFDRPEIRVRVGDTVALRLENRDVATHAFDIDELGVHVAMSTGHPRLALFRPAKPGTFTFHCSVPHHEEMRGTLMSHRDPFFAAIRGSSARQFCRFCVDTASLSS